MDEKQLASLNKYTAPINAMDTPNYFTIVLFGDYGVGKTVWSSQFGKTLILAADPGHKSIKNHPELAENVMVAEYQGPIHWKLLIEAVVNKVPGYDVDTFVIDTMSHIQESFVHKLLETSKYSEGKARPRVIYNNTSEQIKGDPLELPGSPDWNRAKFFFTDGILKLCRVFKGNVIFISHEREPGWMEKSDKNKSSEELAVRPSITESLFKVVAREVDLIGYMEMDVINDKVIRTIQCHKTRKTVGKSRLKELNAPERFSAQKVAGILNNWRTK